MGTGGHSHLPVGEGMTLILGSAVVATFALVLVEVIAGYAGHSIALVSDAVHNLTDVPTLVISWLAIRWARRPPTPEKTYGYHRAGILAAFVNAMCACDRGAISDRTSRWSGCEIRWRLAHGLMMWVSAI